MDQIKNRYTGEIKCGGLSLKIVLEQHRQWINGVTEGKRANLSFANLRGVNLTGVNLTGADLRGADLRGADLSSVDLSGADLRGADLRDVDLRGADLSGVDLRDADLRDADLRDADLRDADLSGVDLRGADLSNVDLRDASPRDSDLSGVPKIKNIHQAVYAAASGDGCLDMSKWHSCKTTHCRAGWVIALAGEAGAAMEFCMDTPTAAALIYLASDPKLERIPDFYASNEDALADMKRLAELEAAA